MGKGGGGGAMLASMPAKMITVSQITENMYIEINSSGHDVINYF